MHSKCCQIGCKRMVQTGPLRPGRALICKVYPRRGLPGFVVVGLTPYEGVIAKITGTCTRQVSALTQVGVSLRWAGSLPLALLTCR